ncbi:hypothetical protein, partial [Salmonella sp. M198]|uniref:hypothetical protein n=1 Tax=Salmonella sp. M198 TaxID=3240293 RepID=UPI00352A43D8
MPHEVDEYAKECPSLAELHPAIVLLSADERTGVDGVIAGKPPIRESVVDLVEVSPDVSVLVVEYETQDVER